MKKTILIILSFTLWIWIIFAATSNYFKSWKNWDANVTTPTANDNWTLTWRLDLEDSRTPAYQTWDRWEIVWDIITDLFGEFTISGTLDLTYREDYNLTYDCWGDTPLEIYNINWTLSSVFWWEMILGSSSYFCSNQYTSMRFNSHSLWDKNIWTIQWRLIDDFDKQQISIDGIANLKWNLEILARWDNEINELPVSVSNNAILKRSLNKNIFQIMKIYLNSTIINKADSVNNIITSDFNNSSTNEEDYYLYDYSSGVDTIAFIDWTDYINKWKILHIWNDWTWEIGITWKNTLIVDSGNIHIRSNLYNTDDTNSLLILVAQRWDDWKGWNIYIDSDVTNIDAILIADGNLISTKTNFLNVLSIQWIIDQTNEIRKQLLIYGSVLSLNSVWTDEIPYWADYYDEWTYINNIMSWSIYDLWNLRTFNLNYWDWWAICSDDTRLVPIDWDWWYLQEAWAWKRDCYNDNNETNIPDPTKNNLRWSDKLNPLIIEYNNRIPFINPYILQK